MHDLISNTTILGESHGGFAFQRRNTWGWMGSLGAGSGFTLSNARDNEIDGRSQAAMAALGLVGVEFDYSWNSNNQFVYTISVTGGKSIGAGFLLMPVQTNTTGSVEGYL